MKRQLVGWQQLDGIIQLNRIKDGFQVMKAISTPLRNMQAYVYFRICKF